MGERERERVSWVSLFLVTGYFLESVTERTSDFEEFTIFSTNAYQKKIEREREKRADLVESWEFRDWEMWKLFDDASAGFVEGKRFDSLSFFCFFLLLFSFFFSLFWFGYLNKLYVDTEFERERERADYRHTGQDHRQIWRAESCAAKLGGFGLALPLALLSRRKSNVSFFFFFSIFFPFLNLWCSVSRKWQR